MLLLSCLPKLLTEVLYCILGLGGIKEAFVIPAILGKSDDIGQWVGCDGKRIMLSEKYNLWHTKIEVIRGLYLARIKLFAKANGTEYLVVVGSVNERT